MGPRLPRSARRLAAAVAAVAAIGLSTATLPVLPARAAAAAGDTTLALVSQPLQVAAGGEATFRLRLEGAVPADARLVVIAREQVRTRGEVRETIDGTVRPQRDRIELPLAEIPLADGQLVVTVPTEIDTTLPERLRLRDAGLHPLTFAVREGERTLAELTTFLERGEVEPEQPSAVVLTSVVTEVDAPPTLQPDGSTLVPDAARAQLDRLLELLELNTTVPFSVVIRPELLEGLQRSGFPADATRLDRLRAVLGSRHEILPTTYVALDPSTAIADDLGVEFSEQLIRGEDTIREAVGTVGSRQVWLLDHPTDGDTLDMLRLLGIRGLLVTGGARADLPEHDGALAAVRTTQGTVVEAVTTDLVVQTRLAQEVDDPVLAAYDVMADLVAMSMEAEADAASTGRDPRPLGVMIDLGAPDHLDPTTTATLLSLLGATPRVQPMLATDQLEQLTRMTPTSGLDRLGLAQPEPAPTTRAATLARLRQAVATTSTMLPTDDPRPARWQALTQVFPAINLDTDARAAYTRQLDGEMGEVRGQLSVLTSDRVSLGGRVSEVPITLVNSGDTPLTVRVRLSSSKLDLQQPDTVVTVEDRMTVEIPVEARTNGVFPVSVELLTPGGAPPASISRPVTFTVQATALTGLGQVISGALVLVLATWWVQHWRARRRAARADAAAAYRGGHPSASTGVG